MACFIDNRYSLVIIDADMEDAGQYGCHCATLSSTALAEMIMLGNLIAGTTLFYRYILRIFTAHKRSLGQGNIFSSVCQEFCSQGGVCLSACWDTTPPGSRHPPRADTPLHSACWEIRSTSGRYASYWNAIFFLFLGRGRGNKRTEPLPSNRSSRRALPLGKKK